MKYIKQLMLLMALIWSPKVFADHMAGGYFEYYRLSNTMWHIDFFFLRDCQGIVPYAPELWKKSDCGDVDECIYLGAMTQIEVASTIDYGCGTDCNNNQGYQTVHFGMNISLSPCDSWTISTAISERNEVEFIENEGNYYNYCKINTLYDNSSPNVSGANLVTGCTSYGVNSLYTVSSTEGDQIVYDLVPALNANVQFSVDDWCYNYPVQYGQGLSATTPFPGTPISILPDGSFEFTPSDIGTSYFAVRAREYRSNVLIGEILIDGIIYVESCPSTNEVTFNSFSNSGNNIMTVSGEPGVYCQSVTIESDEPFEYVWVEGPSYVDYTVQFISSEEAKVTLCVEFPTDNICDPADISVVIHAQAGDLDNCLAEANNVADRGYYIIHKEPGEYCPENLFFTNRNTTTGLAMPIYAHAEERIWVGDNMPPIAPPDILLNQGQVDVIGDLVLEAGTEIIIPACQSGSGCVTFTGDVTLIINPNNCSADCTPEPFDLYVKEMFECSNERLIAEVGGDGPFTFQWQILGQTYTTSNNVFEVHNIVSEQNNGQIPYTCTVYDAIGQTATFTGNILGTQRFYQTITDNKIYFDYPPNTVYGPDGYYYAANLGVYSGTPAYIIDSVNLTPPWYGSTYMRLIVWGRNGLPILDKQTVLEGGEDWSMDNGEFYWNGKEDNDIWGDCYEGQLTEIFNYTLISRNCFDDQDIYQWVDNVDEAGSFWIFGCTNDDPWNPVETKSASADENDYSERNKITGWRRNPELPVSTNELFIQCIPNPTSDEFEVIGNYSQLDQIQLLDQAGKVVYEVKSIKKGEKIDVSHLSAGIYLILIETAIGQQQYKLIKQ